MLLISVEHSISTGTLRNRTAPSYKGRSTPRSSSMWISLDPGAPLQYNSLISDVTSKPRPRAWIELLRVVVKASRPEQKLPPPPPVGFSIEDKFLIHKQQRLFIVFSFSEEEMLLLVFVICCGLDLELGVGELPLLSCFLCSGKERDGLTVIMAQNRVFAMRTRQDSWLTGLFFHLFYQTNSLTLHIHNNFSFCFSLLWSLRFLLRLRNHLSR